MAKVTFNIVKKNNSDASKNFRCPVGGKRDNNDSAFYPAYSEGQLIFVEENDEQGNMEFGKIYLDFNNYRTCFTQQVDYSQFANNLRFLGTVNELPLTNQVTINGKTITAKENDMIVVGTKEYLWRTGKVEENGQMVERTKWYEIGDEDDPGWIVGT